MTVDEPMHADFVYDVELHWLIVKTVVTLVLDDLASPPGPPAPLTQDSAVQSEDIAQAGYERVKVLADPLQLRNELELRSRPGTRRSGTSPAG